MWLLIEMTNKSAVQDLMERPSESPASAKLTPDYHAAGTVAGHLAPDGSAASPVLSVSFRALLVAQAFHLQVHPPLPPHRSRVALPLNELIAIEEGTSAINKGPSHSLQRFLIDMAPGKRNR